MIDSAPAMGWGTTTTHLEELLAAVRRGEPEAMDELIRVAWPRVQGLARAIVHGQSDLAGMGVTDDVCAQGYYQFVEQLKKGMTRPFENMSQLLSYLGVTVRHAAIDEVRRRFGRQFSTQFPRVALDDDPADSDLPGDLVGRLTYQEMIDTLGEDERTVVDAYISLGMTLDEIAAHLKTSRRQVTALWIAALRRLRGRFNDPGV